MKTENTSKLYLNVYLTQVIRQNLLVYIEDTSKKDVNEVLKDINHQVLLDVKSQSKEVFNKLKVLIEEKTNETT